MGPVLFLAMLAALSSPLRAQRQASLGVGAGVVRYAGGSSFSALTIAPAVQHVSPYTYLGVAGAASLLERAVWAGQARADIWTMISRREQGIVPAFSATLATTTRSDGDAAGSASALIEALWPGGVAVALGAASGVIEGVPGVGAVRVRARGWRQLSGSPVHLSFTLEGTRLLGAWYGDAIAGATFDQNRIVASLWASARVSQSSTAAASASVQYFLTPRVAIEALGGNYLRDPFQGLPRAGFVAGGIRLFASRRALTVPAPEAPKPVLQPLIAQRRGDTLVVRFRMPGARAVGIAGNWNSWRPAPLAAVGDDIWEAILKLAPGVYYFNLVVDGNEWVVPGGVATVSDGMGGLLAILNVL